MAIFFPISIPTCLASSILEAPSCSEILGVSLTISCPAGISWTESSSEPFSFEVSFPTGAFDIDGLSKVSDLEVDGLSEELLISSCSRILLEFVSEFTASVFRSPSDNFWPEPVLCAFKFSFCTGIVESAFFCSSIGSFIRWSEDVAIWVIDVGLKSTKFRSGIISCFL